MVRLSRKRCLLVLIEPYSTEGMKDVIHPGIVIPGSKVKSPNQKKRKVSKRKYVKTGKYSKKNKSKQNCNHEEEIHIEQGTSLTQNNVKTETIVNSEKLSKTVFDEQQILTTSGDVLDINKDGSTNEPDLTNKISYEGDFDVLSNENLEIDQNNSSDIDIEKVDFEERVKVECEKKCLIDEITIDEN